MAVVVVGNAYLLEYLCNYSRTMWLASWLDWLTSHSNGLRAEILGASFVQGLHLGPLIYSETWALLLLYIDSLFSITTACKQGDLHFPSFTTSAHQFCLASGLCR